MSHDFAKKNSQKKSSKKRSNAAARKPEPRRLLPGWVLFFSGVAFTLFAQFLWHLAQVDTQTTPADTAKVDAPKAQPKKDPRKRPDIKFYDQLKNQEVRVPDDVVAEREQESYNYALQAGSFKNSADANQQRAEIMLLGLTAKIETRKSESGTTWHRVIVGPFTSRSKLSKARSTLLNNNIQAMKIKRN